MQKCVRVNLDHVAQIRENELCDHAVQKEAICCHARVELVCCS